MSLAQDPSGSQYNNFADTEVDFGYSFYLGWVAVFIQFFAIFFYFIFKAWRKHKEEEERHGSQVYKLSYARAL